MLPYKHIREDKGVLLSQVSEETLISEDMLMRFERGAEAPSLQELNAILDALDNIISAHY